MGNKMKIMVILIFSGLVFYFSDIRDCVKKKINVTDIRILDKKTYKDGSSEILFGIKDICIKRTSQYENILKNFAEGYVNNSESKHIRLKFLKLNHKLEKYHENKWLENLDGIEMNEEFEDIIILYVSRSFSDSTEYEYSWFNSKLSKKNKSIEELIDEVAAPVPDE